MSRKGRKGIKYILFLYGLCEHKAFSRKERKDFFFTQRAQSTREGEAREGQQRKARSSAESNKDGGCTYNICKRLNTGQNT